MTQDPLNYLDDVSRRLQDTFLDGLAVSYNDDRSLPRRESVLRILEELLEILFPGYSGREHCYRSFLGGFLSGQLPRICRELTRELDLALEYLARTSEEDSPAREQTAENAARRLMEKLPEIRENLKLDCRAALDGDPATRSMDEIILAYPGFKAIAVHRIAHELYAAGIPLVPRIMSEYAHSVTGIDIHPGATIGKSFFIDHGTGVVIGETSVLGDNVKLYQGVTLGALSFPKDGCGKIIKGSKRHPNLEDNVTVYAGATILGDVTIAHHSVIGGNVWLTESIPEPYSRVLFSPSELTIKVRKQQNH